MSVKVTITADLVVCQVEVIAEAGQRLLVVNGVCLGVYSGEDLQAPPERPVWPPSMVIMGPGRKKRVGRSARPISHDEVMKILVHGPLTVTEIGDHLRIDRKDQPTRGQIGHRVRELVAAGRLRKPAADTRERYSSWEVVPDEERGPRVVSS